VWVGDFRAQEWPLEVVDTPILVGYPVVRFLVVASALRQWWSTFGQKQQN